jgi:hypothetical protein
MTRAILLVLLLGGCGLYEFPEETGAPPRLMPSGMRVEVYRVAPEYFPRGLQQELKSEGGRLRAWTRTTRTLCTIEITDEPLPLAEYEHILAHERRHCAGQQHELQWVRGTPVLVWLP